MNVEALLVAAYTADEALAHAPAAADVPAARPARFLTVERTGGGPDQVTDRPLVAIQVWASSRAEAGDLAQLVAERTRRLAIVHPQVARVDIQSIYNNPDPSSGQARYQITAQLVVHG